MAEIIFTDANFEKEALQRGGLVVVDFFASWCGPCKMMAPSVEKLAEEYAGMVHIGKLNVDDNNAVANQYEIQSIPTIIFFKDGEMVEKLVGFQSYEALKEKIVAHS
jgi:thioredoxin 1